MRNRFIIPMAILFLAQVVGAAEDPGTWEDAAHPAGYEREFTIEERAANFAVIYGLQWGFYLVSQSNEIRKYGSFKNWVSYPLRPHFDKDSFDYNLTKHTLTGSFYYLYYRSRGYTYQASFLWSYLSSLAFELTIETVTERPSFQDMYQTPVFGTVLGFGLEKLSRNLHASDTWYGTALGYLFNPFTLLAPPGQVTSLIYPQKDRWVLEARMEF